MTAITLVNIQPGGGMQWHWKSEKTIGVFLQPMLKNRTVYIFFSEYLLSHQEKSWDFMQDIMSWNSWLAPLNQKSWSQAGQDWWETLYMSVVLLGLDLVMMDQFLGCPGKIKTLGRSWFDNIEWYLTKPAALVANTTVSTVIVFSH
jgi:hypothetical protein